MPGRVPLPLRLCRRFPVRNGWTHGRWVRRAGLAIIGVAGLDGLSWLAAQHLLDTARARWTTQLVEQGWTVRTGPTTRGGSPLAARLTLWGPRLYGPVGRRTAAWGADGLALSVSLLHPATLQLNLIGTQALRLSTPDRPADDIALHGQGKDAVIAIPLAMRPDALAGHVSWSARQLEVHLLDPEGGETAVRLHALRGHGLWNAGAGPDASRLALAITADQIDLPPTWYLPGHLPWPLPRSWLTSPQPPARPDMRALHNGGLTIAFPGGPSTGLLLQDAHATWSTLSLHLVGRATCPSEGGPDGTFTLSVAGIGLTIGSLEQDGTIAPELARAVAAIDRWAARTGLDRPEQGGVQQGNTGQGTTGQGNTGSDGPAAATFSNQRIDLPLHLRAGSLFLGTLPIGSIAPTPP
jgi:Uncharacterized protein conserved in bacteria (DUF2125)